MIRIAIWLLLSTLALSASAQEPASDHATKEREAKARLDAVRAEIKTLTEAQRALEGERSAATTALRDADQAVNREARALRDIDAGLAEQQTELERLEQEKAALEQRLRSQREALAELLRSAYALGRHEQLKLLLAQDRIDQLARVLAYHRYFQRDRVTRIESLLGELRELAQLGEAVIAQRETLNRSREAQSARIAELETQRTTRRELLTQLDAQFADAKSRLAALGRDERALVKLLASLRDVFADIPKQLDEAKPFAQRRGGLRRPLPGKVLNGFGARLPDGRPSQGWLIAGDTGANVAAVAPGRVAFADWLKGYGLILILDHGDGYMSLYAQSDSLLKDVGDWVAPGEAVAGVGSSGGQGQAALYFELRHNGRPIDPKAWFSAQ